MGDPLSVTASILAVVGCAAQTCGYLCKSLKGFLDAQSDLEQHVNTIRSLRTIFSSIAALLEEYPEILQLCTLEFEERLRTCTSELRRMEQSMRSYAGKIEKGGSSRTWARLGLASPWCRERMRKQLKCIEIFHASFSLDLLLLNA